jgi:hypothetical protein
MRRLNVSGLPANEKMSRYKKVAWVKHGQSGAESTDAGAYSGANKPGEAEQ